MINRLITGAVGSLLTVVSLNASAIVLNNLNGIDYEWQELSVTQGLSRNDVELRMADANDVLFGYQYASRSLFADLLNSYATTWDGVSGWHGEAAAVTDIERFQQDFGITFTASASSFSNVLSHDSIRIWTSGADKSSSGRYGETGECGALVSCVSTVKFASNNQGVGLAAYISSNQGFNSSDASPATMNLQTGYNHVGSYLVRPVNVVPVPAAVWLFGSGLIGLIGLARRKSRA